MLTVIYDYFFNRSCFYISVFFGTGSFQFPAQKALWSYLTVSGSPRPESKPLRDCEAAAHTLFKSWHYGGCGSGTAVRFCARLEVRLYRLRSHGNVGSTNFNFLSFFLYIIKCFDISRYIVFFMYLNIVYIRCIIKIMHLQKQNVL